MAGSMNSPIKLGSGLSQKDLTPESASPTDIAPLGRAKKPSHELTAQEEITAADWKAIAADEEFALLLRAKFRFILPATIFFIVYYFLLPISVGWFPDFMARRLPGGLNLAYLFALSQFFMAWALAFLYLSVAMRWDLKAASLVRKFFVAKGQER